MAFKTKHVYVTRLYFLLHREHKQLQVVLTFCEYLSLPTSLHFESESVRHSYIE